MSAVVQVNERPGPRPSRWNRMWITPVAFALVGAAACLGVLRMTGVIAPPPAVEPEPESAETEAGGAMSIRFPEGKWTAAGIRIEPAVSAPFTDRVWRTGHLALNDSRIAHITPMVEGVVREVKVRLGQDVKAGDVLALLDSREVGEAKLELVKSRTAAEYARVQHQWTTTAGRNAVELVDALAAGVPVAEIEKRFKDRTIGELRQQLITAFSRKLQTRAHYDAANSPDTRDAVSQATLIQLKADSEAAEATYRAISEEVKYQTGQQVRAAEQKLREARNAEALSKTQLLMLGYSREEVEAMDPIAEGPAVSLYPIRAPFAGVVIDQHAVLAERVGPAIQLFRIADLTTLWLQADILQSDLALAQSLAGGQVRFRSSDAPAAVRVADVFYTGDLVDRATRAVALRATVGNADRALKPGMFVEVELTRSGGKAVQVPGGAVQRDGAQPFVFVHGGGDEFRRVDVQLGREAGGMFEVVQGLEAGTPVAVAGGFILKSELLKDQMAGD